LIARSDASSASNLVPLLKGVGLLMYEPLRFTDREAEQDLPREVPAMCALARLVALLHPLSPLGRGIGAVVTVRWD
jgi:hypothetical protein